MQKTTLKQQLLFLLGSIVLGLLVIGGTVLYTVSQTRIGSTAYQQIVQSKDLIADVLPPPEYIIESYLLSRELVDAPAGEQEALVKRLTQLEKEFEERHAFWQKEDFPANLRVALLDKSAPPAKAFYAQLRGQLIPAVRAGHTEEAQNQLREMRKHYLQHRQHIDEVVEKSTLLNQQAEARASEQVNFALTLLLAIFAAVTACAIALVAAISRSIVRQVGGEPGEALQLVDALAKGELRHADNPAAGGGIIGATRQLGATLRQTVGNIHAATTSVNQVVPELQADSVSLRQMADQQSTAAAAIAAAVEQLSASISQANDDVQNVLQQSSASGDSARAGVVEMQQLGTSLRQILAEVASVADAVGRLGEQSGEIDSIVNVISGIAEQTNLLALNAAIEAARAGESGRGFAVVADEVRKLAERTTVSTTEIAQVVQRIQSSIQEIVGTIAKTSGQVEQAVEVGSRTGDDISAISDAVGQTVSGVQSIADALAEQNMAAQSLAQSLEEVAESAERTAEVAAANQRSATGLAGTSQDLQAAVSHFRV